MRNLIFVCFASVLLLFSAAMSQALQDTAVLADKLEQTIKAKEPSWKLKSRVVRKVENEDYVIMIWKKKKGYVDFTISQRSSPEEAIQLLHDAPSGVSFGVITKLPNFGEGAVLITSGQQDPSASVVFRKGSKYVSVHGSTKEVAKLFAQYIAQQLD